MQLPISLPIKLGIGLLFCAGWLVSYGVFVGLALSGRVVFRRFAPVACLAQSLPLSGWCFQSVGLDFRVLLPVLYAAVVDFGWVIIRRS